MAFQIEKQGEKVAMQERESVLWCRKRGGCHYLSICRSLLLCRCLLLCRRLLPSLYVLDLLPLPGCLLLRPFLALRSLGDCLALFGRNILREQRR